MHGFDPDITGIWSNSWKSLDLELHLKVKNQNLPVFTLQHIYGKLRR